MKCSFLLGRENTQQDTEIQYFDIFMSYKISMHAPKSMRTFLLTIIIIVYAHHIPNYLSRILSTIIIVN